MIRIDGLTLTKTKTKTDHPGLPLEPAYKLQSSPCSSGDSVGCKSQIHYSLVLFSMPRIAGTPNKFRVNIEMSPWYREKVRELRRDSGFESDDSFSRWLLQNTVQILAGEREPEAAKLSDLRLRMEDALAALEEPMDE